MNKLAWKKGLQESSFTQAESYPSKLNQQEQKSSTSDKPKHDAPGKKMFGW